MAKSSLIHVDITDLFFLLGEKLLQLEEQKGIVIRFTIGHT